MSSRGNTDDNIEAASLVISDLISKYGMQLILEALIHHNDAAIVGAQMFAIKDDYLLMLRANLEKTLEEYKGRHNEFGS